MQLHMDKSMRTTLILATIIVAFIVAAFWAASTFWLPPSPFGRREPPPFGIPGDIEFYYTAQTIVSTINVALSVFLLLIYVSIYEKTRSQFTIGLIIFSAVFLLNALASNPLLIRLFGFRPFGLGPFALLPDLFTFGALVVLLYLSVKY